MTMTWPPLREGAVAVMVCCVLVQVLPIAAAQHHFALPSTRADVTDHGSRLGISLSTRHDIAMNALQSYLAALIRRPSHSETDIVITFYDEVPQVLQEGAFPLKRSRFFRYPWKRQNRRALTTPLNPMCNPTREEIFRLLVAVHNTKTSTGPEPIVNFCNRKQTASAALTNIRLVESTLE